MADKNNDPLAMWHTMLGEMEKNYNAFATQAMTSPEFSKVMNQVGGPHKRPRYAGRAAAAATATGLMSKHLAQLKAFLEEALG